MGLLGKKEGIVCCKCHVSNDKLAKKYQKAKGPDRTVSFPAGSFKIVDVSKTMDLNEMVQCRDCGAYFCEKCGKKAAGKKGSSFSIRCPACNSMFYNHLKEYAL